MLEEIPPALVSVREVSRRLGVAPITVYRWVAAGNIPGVVRTGYGKRKGVRIPAEWLRQTLIAGRMPEARRIGGGHHS